MKERKEKKTVGESQGVAMSTDLEPGAEASAESGAEAGAGVGRSSESRAEAGAGVGTSWETRTESRAEAGMSSGARAESGAEADMSSGARAEAGVGMDTGPSPGGAPGGGSVVLRGAALLGGAALLSKLIGTLQKIPLQNLAGDRVFGLYSAVYSLAIMWMTLAAAGVPVAVSALVAERTAAGDDAGARRVLRGSVGLLTATGLIAFALLQAGADRFAEWMGAPEAADAIRTSSLALLFSPMTAALRGYSQGRMNMLRPAVSQLAEQTARVAFMLVMLFAALEGGWSAGGTAAAVHGGLAAGASAGLAAMLWMGRGERRRGAGARLPARAERSVAADKVGGDDPLRSGVTGSSASSGTATSAAVRTRKRQRAPRDGESAIALLKRIAAVALPVAAGSIVAPLFGLIDAFTVPRLLQGAGSSAAEALASFGAYNRGIALLQLVVMAAGGAGAALVPALTAARARGDIAGQREQAALALRLAWWFGAASAVGLALLAGPVNVALFADGRGTAAMALLAFAALGGTLQAVLTALLQGLGDLRSPALYLAAAALLKAALNAALAPAYGIAGVAAAAIAAYAAAAALNALALRRLLARPGLAGAAGGWSAAASPAANASAGPSDAALRAAPAAGGPGFAWRTAAALAAMAAAVAPLRLALAALAGGLPARAGALVCALPCIAAGALVFAAALVRLGAVGPRELAALPGLGGSRAERWLARLQPRSRRLKLAPEAPGAEGPSDHSERMI